MPGGFCFDNCCGATNCNVTICVHVNGGATGSVTVNAKSGGSTIATGTTSPATGCVVLDVGSAGTYTFEAMVSPPYTACSKSIAVLCGGTYTIDLATITATGCQSGVALAGATVSVAGQADQVTDATGRVYYCLASGSYAYTATHSRFMSITSDTSWDGVTPKTAEFGLVGPATGYTCLPLFCNIPVSNTLNGTDAQLGAFTATYSSTLLLWEGIRTVNYAADAACGCVARTGITIRYRWPNDAGTGDHRIQVAARLISGCPAVGAVNTAFLPFTGGHSEACEPFDIIDQYDAGCGVGAIIWPAPPTNTVTLTE